MSLMLGQKPDGTPAPIPLTSDGSQVATTATQVGGTFVTAAEAANGAAVPAKAMWTGASDGTNLQGALAFDCDSGAGSQWLPGFSLRLPGAGGSVAGGTVANPVVVTGPLTDTQLRASAVPVSGPLTDTQLRASVVPVKPPTWPTVFSTVLAAKLIVKGSPGTLRSVSFRLDATAATLTYYVHVWNLTDIPIPTTVADASNLLAAPRKVIHVSGTDDFVTIDFPEGGVVASTGITIGLSLTEFVQSVAGAYLSATASAV